MATRGAASSMRPAGRAAPRTLRAHGIDRMIRLAGRWSSGHEIGSVTASTQPFAARVARAHAELRIVLIDPGRVAPRKARYPDLGWQCACSRSGGRGIPPDAQGHFLRTASAAERGADGPTPGQRPGARLLLRQRSRAPAWSLAGVRDEQQRRTEQRLRGTRRRSFSAARRRQTDTSESLPCGNGKP